MRDARFLIRLSNEHHATPAEHAALLERLRRLATPLPGEIMNLRVTPRALEFDLFCAADVALESYFRQWQGVGTVVSVRRLLGLATKQVDASAIVEEARTYFNEARYWEVHEVLEDLWKARTGDEKQLVQGLILIAAALVHTQKNEWKVVWPMVREGLKRLEHQPFSYHTWNIDRFRAAFQTMADKQMIEAITV